MAAHYSRPNREDPIHLRKRRDMERKQRRDLVFADDTYLQILSEGAQLL